jgi:hypothetical protein
LHTQKTPNSYYEFSISHATSLDEGWCADLPTQGLMVAVDSSFPDRTQGKGRDLC